MKETIREKKALSAILVTLTVALLLTMSMSVACATPPVVVSGTIKQTGPFTSTTEWHAGKSDNLISIQSGAPGEWTGDISGTATYSRRVVWHNVGGPLLLIWINAHGIYTLEAVSIFGSAKSGTLYIEVEINTGNPQPNTWRITGGTGDLANLHGQGTFDLVGGKMAYTGQVHFDP